MQILKLIMSLGLVLTVLSVQAQDNTDRRERPPQVTHKHLEGKPNAPKLAKGTPPAQGSSTTRTIKSGHTPVNNQVDNPQQVKLNYSPKGKTTVKKISKAKFDALSKEHQELVRSNPDKYEVVE